MITRQQILTATTTYHIMEHFLKDYYEEQYTPFKPGHHIYVPEISGKQKTPSFNIYKSSRSGEWRYKDFTGHDGSAFDLVMHLFDVKLPQACKIINQDMELGLDADSVDYKKVQPKIEPKINIERNYEYDIDFKKWDSRHLEFWSRYGTGFETLNKYHIKPVQRLSGYRKDNTIFEIESRSESLIYAFEAVNEETGEIWYKYYMPEVKVKGIIMQRKGFGYLGKKPEGYVFGLDQLPEKGDACYLISGEKDTVNMHSHGMWGVCLTSEESTPKNYPKFMELLDSDRFDRYYILYDNDPTGRRQMLNITSEIPKLKMQVWDIKDGDDISDFLMSTYSKLMF
jgi:hypothetical protein